MKAIKGKAGRFTSVLLAVIMILMYTWPEQLMTADAADQPGSEGQVPYEHRGDTTKWVTEDGSQNPVYCVQPTRSPTSDGWNANYRYRWNLSANSWLLDNNKRSLTNNTYAIDSWEIDKLARILYVGFGHNATGLGNGVSDVDFYKATQDAVFWVICYGKDNAPNYAGKSYKKGLAGQIIEAANSVTLPEDRTLYMYVPDSESAGNLQNTVRLKVGSSTAPTPEPSTNNVSVTVKTTKVFVGGELGNIDWHQFGFKLTGTPEDLVSYNHYSDVYFNDITFSESDDGKTYNCALKEITDASESGVAGDFRIFDDITYDTNTFDLSFTVNKEGDVLTLNINNPASYVYSVETNESGEEKLVSLNDGDDISGKVIQVGKFTNRSKNMKTTVTAGGKTASEDGPARLTDKEGASTKTVTDKIEYYSLRGGATYEVTGELYEVVDGEVSGSPIATKTEDKQADASGKGTWDIVISGVTLEPGKKYVVYETATNKDDSSDVLEHKNPNDNSQAIVVQPKFGTTVQVNGEPAPTDKAVEITSSEEKVTVDIVDTIIYKGLKNGSVYRITYTVKNVTDNIVVKTETVNTDYPVINQGEDNWTVPIGSIELDCGETGVGKKYVIYEKAVNVDDENDVLIHEDDNDLSQMININRTEELNPAISTTVSAGGQSGSDSKAVELTADEAKGVSTVIDTVKYEGLTINDPGEGYTIEGTLMKVENGTATSTGKTASKSFDVTSTSEQSGTAEIVFDGVTLEPGTKYVVYEVLKQNGQVVKDKDGNEVKHEDVSDKAQTIIVEEEPKPEIKNTTINADGKNGSDTAPVEVKLSSGNEVPIKDKVELINVKEGTYTIEWELYDKNDTTSAAKSGSEKVTVLKDGDLTTEIDLGNIDIDDKTYTIKTILKDANGGTISTHNGTFDTTRETVKLLERTNKGKLSTTVSYNGTESTASSPVKIPEDELQSVTVKDTIKYEDMDPGYSYNIIATLNEVEDGKFVKTIKTVQKEKQEASSTGSGEWEVEFTDVTLEPGKTYVVYEYAENDEDSDDNASHRDPTDKSQTILASPAEVTIKVSKQDLGGTEISGAEMQVTGNGVDEKWTSDGKPHEITLQNGDYTMTEVVAPKGYKKVTTKMKFTVNAVAKDDGSGYDAEVTLNTAEVNNGGKIKLMDKGHIVLEDATEAPNLVAKKTTATKTAKEGDTIDYTITIKNTGKGFAKGVTITDIMGEELDYVKDSRSGSASGQEIEWKKDFAPGEEYVIKITCKVNDLVRNKDTITNKVKITPEEYSGSYSDTTDQALVGVTDDNPTDTDRSPTPTEEHHRDSDDVRDVKTGDDANIWLYALIALAASGIWAGLKRSAKRKN